MIADSDRSAAVLLKEKLDEALAQVARREREHEALLETAQKALAHVEAERAEIEMLRDDAEDHALRRVLTGALNGAISAQKAKAATMAAEHGRSSRQHRTAVARLDELRDAHNKLQSLQVDYSHARMLLGGWVQARKTGDVGDEEFHLRLAREYFEERE